MDSLFSHAAVPPESIHREADALKAEVVVPVRPSVAFEALTDLIHLWWPLALYSAWGPGSGADHQLDFEGDYLVEESPDGERKVWGAVRRWNPPSTVVLNFFLDSGPVAPSRLQLSCQSQPATDSDHPEGTLVTVSQDERSAGEPEQPTLDWGVILGRFARFMGVAEVPVRIDRSGSTRLE
ncbi:hypothetical protein [Psychromicrobium xiongbiense]|uniref:hypothetical protein n=1 Tax=Psychromicrobium xiongbiense TaxID=3051184 RepID=UPI00255355B3|nr:hypothetical protein [Psychromicrobium sp. YIM S02556]